MLSQPPRAKRSSTTSRLWPASIGIAGTNLLIALQRPYASHLAGFHTWRKFNRFARKGAKGIAIAPMVSKKSTKGEDTEDEKNQLFGLATLSQSLQYIQSTAIQILMAIGAAADGMRFA